MKRVYIGLAWAAVHLARRLHHPLPLLNGYLTDVLAVPAITGITLAVTRRWIVRDPGYTYPPAYFLFVALYLSVVFEWIMPHWSHAFTADWGDVAAYFAGALACFLIRERHFLRRG